MPVDSCSSLGRSDSCCTLHLRDSSSNSREREREREREGEILPLSQSCEMYEYIYSTYRKRRTRIRRRRRRHSHTYTYITQMKYSVEQGRFIQSPSHTLLNLVPLPYLKFCGSSIRLPEVNPPGCFLKFEIYLFTSFWILNF